jgi:ribosomal protein S27AE
MIVKRSNAATLKFTNMKCPKCHTDVIEETIDGRKRQTCPQCSYMHYDPRKDGGGYDEITDDIADEVATNGASEAMATVLINTVFRADPGGKSSADQMAEWCQIHGFHFSTHDGKDANGKKAQFIRFARI